MTQSQSSTSVLGLTKERKLQRQNKRRVRFCPEVVLVRDEDVVVPSTYSSNDNSDKDNISQLLWWSKGEIKSFEKSSAIYTKLTNRRQCAVLFGMLETAQSATQDLLASEERERQRRDDEKEADDPAMMGNDNDSLPPEESSSSIAVSVSDAENWSSSCSDRRGLEHTIPQYHDKKRLFCRRAKRNETKARVIKMWRQRSLGNSVDEEQQQQQQRLLEEEIAKAYERDCLVDRIFARMLGRGDAVAVAPAAAEANSEQDDVVGTINKTIPVLGTFPHYRHGSHPIADDKAAVNVPESSIGGTSSTPTPPTSTSRRVERLRLAAASTASHSKKMTVENYSFDCFF